MFILCVCTMCAVNEWRSLCAAYYILYISQSLLHTPNFFLIDWMEVERLYRSIAVRSIPGDIYSLCSDQAAISLSLK